MESSNISGQDLLWRSVPPTTSSSPHIAMNKKLSSEYIEMKFGPRWHHISTIRSFIHNFLNTITGDPRKADRISMSISELMENAVKYSYNDETYLKISIENDGEIVSVTVKNKSTPAQAEELIRFLAFLETMSPLEGYMEMMKRSADSGKSQIGLARIRYEAGAKLYIQYDEESRITVRARFHLQEKTYET